jgi:uncharacterized protein
MTMAMSVALVSIAVLGVGVAWGAGVGAGVGSAAIPSTEEPGAALRAELWKAVTQGDLETVRRLVDASPALASIHNEKEVSAPLFALYYRRTEIADLLIARKEAGGASSSLDIFEAAAFGRVDRLESILEEDPKLANAFAPDGFFPLGLAAFYGREQAVAALLARGADPNATARNPMKVRALHAAAASGSVSIARRLVEAGADVDAPQEGGFTPLHEASSSGQLELARLLLEHGANVEARADDGRTALDMAREKNRDALVELLSARR